MSTATGSEPTTLRALRCLKQGAIPLEAVQARIGVTARVARYAILRLRNAGYARRVDRVEYELTAAGVKLLRTPGAAKAWAVAADHRHEAKHEDV